MIVMEKKYFNFFISVLFLITTGVLILSCYKSRIEKDLQQLIGEKIVIPYDNLLSKCKNPSDSLLSCDYKYVLYYDSAVCSSCTLKNMYYWRSLRDSITKTGAKVKLIYIFTPKKKERVKFLRELEKSNLDLISFVDTSAAFLRTNKFVPQNINAHSFLLNSKDEIIMVGNAQNKSSIEKLFLKLITRPGTNEK